MKFREHRIRDLLHFQILQILKNKNKQQQPVKIFLSDEFLDCSIFISDTWNKLPSAEPLKSIKFPLSIYCNNSLDYYKRLSMLHSKHDSSKWILGYKEIKYFFLYVFFFLIIQQLDNSLTYFGIHISIYIG